MCLGAGTRLLHSRRKHKTSFNQRIQQCRRMGSLTESREYSAGQIAALTCNYFKECRVAHSSLFSFIVQQNKLECIARIQKSSQKRFCPARTFDLAVASAVYSLAKTSNQRSSTLHMDSRCSKLALCPA